MKSRVVPATGSVGLLVAALAANALAMPAPPPTSAGPPSMIALDARPLGFTENLGQWPEAIRFSASAPGALVEFESGSVTYILSRRPAPSGSLETLALRTTFPGARSEPVLAGERPTFEVSHYYEGRDPSRWRTGVRNFGAVRYADLYPGIDLVYHGRDGAMEYDFELAPGADWRHIRARLEGVDRMAVTPEGDLELGTRFGSIRQREPVAWQTIRGERRPVRVSYRLLDDHTFGFNVSTPLDPTAPLVIDPVLHYSTYLGGSSYDEAHAIDYDAAGEAWVVGGTLSPNFPATGSPVPSTHYSVFVTRLAANGQSQVWSVFLGGSADQIGLGLDVDLNGNAFISGITGSNNFPTTAGCYDASFNSSPGDNDEFVAKLSPSGALLYSTYLGGTSSDNNSGLRLHGTIANRVYVCGDVGLNYPTTAGCYDASANGGSDVGLSVLDLAGLGPADLVYSTYLGGNDFDESHGLAVDVAGRAYVGGATRSSNFPASGGPPFNGTFDAFVALIDPAGTGPADLVISEKFGGSGQDYGGAVAVDFFGVAVDGVTTSTNFPTTSGAYQTSYGGGIDDGFVMLLIPSSSFFVFYSTYLGGSGTDHPGALHMTFGAEVTVTGYTGSANFPTTAGAYDPTYNGGFDMFLARFDQSGANLLEGSFIGGSSDDVAYDFKVDVLGRRYLTGTTNSTNFPTTPLAFDTSYNGAPFIDGVVLKFQPPHPEVCAACVVVADTCCARAPRFQGATPAPSLSSHVLVGTSQQNQSSPYVVTVFDLGSPAPTEDVEWSTISRYTGPGAGWNQTVLGTVFGLTLDEFGNIFVTHASCYDGDQLGTVPGGGPGAIYRIDAVTGAINTFCRLPNYPDPSITPGEDLPGLGNISYDCRHHQFFVTDLEDGRIYRIKANGVNGATGTIQQTFDPGVQDLGPTNYQTPVGSVPSPGWAPLGERLWGVQWHMDRVFYGVWAEDIGAPSPTISNEVRSVGLNAAGAFVGASDQHELFLPSMPTADYSMPVSDISFDAGGKLLIAERGVTGNTSSSFHMARNLEYRCENGCWIAANAYTLGVCCQGANAVGGVDYDHFPYTGGPLGRVWGSAEAIHLGYPPPAEIFGYQGSRPTGGSNFTGIIIDYDGNALAVDKSVLGDIEAPGCPNDPAGSICGRKFQDTNHNGVQDGGETGLPGWTITLIGPGGPVTLITDEQGNYCFDLLAAGSYTVGEVTVPGWVQTAPSGGTYTVALAAAQNVTGLNFGNYHCTGIECVGRSPMLAAAWSFGESPGATSTIDAMHLSPALNVAQLNGGATIGEGRAGNGLCVPAPGAHAKVANAANQMGTTFGTNAFAIDAWLKPDGGVIGPRTIVEKRRLIGASPYRTVGWALYLNGLQCFLEIGDGSTTQIVTGPSVAAGSWSHLAVAVDRSASGGRWYLDGAAAGAAFTPIAGSVSCTADIYLGQASPGFGAAAFRGCLDEIELFTDPAPPGSIMSAAKAAVIHEAVVIGRCPETLLMPSTKTICQNQTSVQVCFNIGNNTAAPQSYHWSVAGVSPGPGCTVPGPAVFNPSAGIITVPGGSYTAPICITIPRPAWLTAQGATSCFVVTIVNDATGACLTRNGTIRVDNTCWCVTMPGGVVPVPSRIAGGVMIGIPVGHPCDPINTPYRLMPVSLNTAFEDPLAVSLNGLPPGQPVTGTLALGPGGSDPLVSVNVRYPDGYDGAAPYEIVLEADLDGNGVLERIGGTVVVSTYDSTQTVSVAPAAEVASVLELRAAPNPFVGGAMVSFSLTRADAVEVGVYDLSGRAVRVLHSGRLAPGAHRIEWNGRDESGRRAPAGIYFVRLETTERHVEAKVVKLR